MQRGWSSASGATILLGLLFLGPIQVLLLTCGMTVGESCPSGPNWPALAIGVAFVALGVSAIVSKTNRRRPPRRPG